MTELTLKDIKTGNVKARNGWEVRILASDLTGPYPVCFLATCKEKNVQVILRATATGRYSDTDDKLHACDLVLIVKPQYFNIHTGPDGRSHTDPMCGSIDGIKDQAFKSSRRNWSCETFKYHHGEVTKVEPEEHE